MRFSNQAVGAIMMALQKGIMEQTDITDMVKSFELTQTVDGLIVENPPTLNFAESNTEEADA